MIDLLYVPEIRHRIRVDGDHDLSTAFQETLKNLVEPIGSHIDRKMGVDPDLLLRAASTAWEKKLITEATFGNLFWIYRNVLVHEFREPGHGFEFDQREESPYSHTASDVEDDSSEEIELVFPLGFFFDTARRVLMNLKAWYKTSDFDPYSRYQFGSPWKRRQ